MTAPNDPQLTAYILGELTAEEKALLDAEIQNSPELQRAVEEIRETTGLLNGAFQSEPQPTLMPGQRAAIEQQSAAPSTPRKTLPRRSAWAYGVMGTAAALLVMIAGLGVYQANGPGANTTFNSIANAISNANGEPPLVGDSESMSRRDTDFETESMHELPMLDAFNPASRVDSYRSEEAPGANVGLNASGRPTADLDLWDDVEAVEFSEFGEPAAPRSDLSAVTGAVPGNGVEGRGRVVREVRQPQAPGGERNLSTSPPGIAPASEPAGTAPAATPAPTASEAAVDGAPEPVDEETRVNNTTTPGRPAKPGDAGGSKQNSKGGEAATGKKPLRTWRRARATPNASRLMIGDKDELPLEGMQVNVQVDGFRARVLVDLYYYNNRGRQLEGAFKIRLPNEASLYYFAFGETSFEYRPQVDQLASKGFLTAELVRASGTGPGEIFKARSETWSKVKEARIVPREKAAHAYSETVRRRVDPALVEWSGAGMFNAKVYPLMPRKLHRIVIGYDVNLQQSGDDLVYSLDLPEHRAETSVDINVSALPGTSANIKPEVRPFLASGRAYYHYADPQQSQIKVRLQNPGAVLLQGNDGHSGDYFATRVTPQLPGAKAVTGSDTGVFLLDTSLSSNPGKFNVWLSLLEETLTRNRDVMKRFAVLTFNIESHWWRPGYVENTAENVKRLMHDCSQLSLEGATALRQALAEAVTPHWAGADADKQDKKLTAPDIFLLSDGSATWGETSLPFIAATLKQGSGGTLFAYNTGLTGTAVNVLQKLTRDSGGAVFSVMGQSEVAGAATAHRQRPWMLEHATVAGGDDVLLAGRAKTIYPGQSLLLTGRGKPTGDVLLQVSRGNQKKTITVPLQQTVASDLAPRLYGEVATGQLEDLQAAAYDVSVAYARHFRVTGQTCSLLMLDSEADYKRFNIKPEDDLDVIKSSPASNLIARRIDAAAAKLDNPKAATLAWIKRLETTPGVTFRIPTAMRLMLEELPAEAFEVKIPQLVCDGASRSDMSKEMLRVLGAAQLDYDAIVTESNRRRTKYGPADALKTLSSLIENSPGDTVLARDVAFSAMDLGLSGQAYPLLKRVAEARPYLPQVYQAMGQCLAALGNADLAMIYYEIALGGNWHDRYQDFNQIAAVEYSHLLRRIDSGGLKTQAPHFARTRLQTVAGQTPFASAGLVVTMMWNTDRTDVDLHVVEPSGEEVYYKHRNSRGGGTVSRDVTQGFGPEMYSIAKAARGSYTVKANYYGSDTNRTTARSKVYLTIYENFGQKDERVSRKTVSLSRGKEMRTVATVQIKQ